jgi:hypothetical protein
VSIKLCREQTGRHGNMREEFSDFLFNSLKFLRLKFKVANKHGYSSDNNADDDLMQDAKKGIC